MKIAILTTGRFHVCDLARELDALGHDVAFYSLVPPWRLERFGLPRRCQRWLLPYVAPVAALARAALGSAREPLAFRLLTAALDEVAARLVARCDVFIGMSGMSGRTVEAVRRRFGARAWIERGSRHVLSQRAILEAMPRPPGAPPPVPDYAVARELDDYARADRIVVPARHVVESFHEAGVPAHKLFRNPYGVDLTMFPPTPRPSGPPCVLFVGTWSRQKGCDVLVQAWRRLPGVRLMHVGTVGDLPLPTEHSFEHVPHVDQRELTHQYARGDVLALASRQEGQALVQAQALASGLDLVCTDRSGGEDLGELIGDPARVRVVPPDDADALAEAVASALRGARAQRGLPPAARDALSWTAYGRRYDAELRR